MLETMKILLAESDEHLGAVTKAVLVQAGHAVDWTKETDEALLYLGGYQFDLLILADCKIWTPWRSACGCRIAIFRFR